MSNIALYCIIIRSSPTLLSTRVSQISAQTPWQRNLHEHPHKWRWILKWPHSTLGENNFLEKFPSLPKQGLSLHWIMGLSFQCSINGIGKRSPSWKCHVVFQLSLQHDHRGKKPSLLMKLACAEIANIHSTNTCSVKMGGPSSDMPELNNSHLQTKKKSMCTPEQSPPSAHTLALALGAVQTAPLAQVTWDVQWCDWRRNMQSHYCGVAQSSQLPG